MEISFACEKSYMFGFLTFTKQAKGLVIFVHVSDCSRFSKRNISRAI